MASYDIMGNIALFKFPRGMKLSEKKTIANEFLAKSKNVRTVLEKTDRIKGRLRTPETKFIAGINTKEAIYRENGCVFRFNVDTSYFSPRLADQRKEIAEYVKKGENVIVMFGGVAPFAIVIAKQNKAKRVVSVELNRKSQKYAKENIVSNNVKVDLIQGDVRKVSIKMKDKFDRIVMARPNLEDSFLDSAFRLSKKGTIIHYYGFYDEDKLNELINLIKIESKKARKNISKISIKKAGDIGVRKYRYRADFKIL